MKYAEIARFLNISEECARALGEKKLMPGRTLDEGWEATFEELEIWYVKFTGKEWADLVSDGKIDPLVAEVDFRNNIGTGELLRVIKSWENKGKVKIVSHNISQNLEVFVVLLDIAEGVEENLEILRNTRLSKYLESQIEIAYQCEDVIGRNPVTITLAPDNILKLCIENNMVELPQRDREVIRFYLAKYGLELLEELQREHKRRN